MSLALNREEWKLLKFRANTQVCEANDDDDHTPNLCILISYDQ
jgi:hypothetical protein